MDYKYIVTFHRTYEIPEKDVIERLEDSGFTKRDMEGIDFEYEAELIAREFLSEELPEFVNNTEDFVSATIERI